MDTYVIVVKLPVCLACTVVSRKRAHGWYTLLCVQTGGWADICNIAAFYLKKAPCLHYHNHCTPTHPASTAGSCEFLDCWWQHVVGVHRHRTHITKQWTEVRLTVCSSLLQRYTISTLTPAVVVVGNTVGHVPTEISSLLLLFGKEQHNYMQS